MGAFGAGMMHGFGGAVEKAGQQQKQSDMLKKIMMQMGQGIPPMAGAAPQGDMMPPPVMGQPGTLDEPMIAPQYQSPMAGQDQGGMLKKLMMMFGGG